jgi:hypothetical protein
MAKLDELMALLKANRMQSAPNPDSDETALDAHLEARSADSEEAGDIAIAALLTGDADRTTDYARKSLELSGHGELLELMDQVMADPLERELFRISQLERTFDSYIEHGDFTWFYMQVDNRIKLYTDDGDYDSALEAASEIVFMADEKGQEEVSARYWKIVDELDERRMLSEASDDEN